MKKLAIAAAMLAAAPMIAACGAGGLAGVGLTLLGEAIAPELADRLAPEIKDAIRALQGTGAVVVEQRFERKFAAVEAAVERGDIATPAAASSALAEADARMKLLERLRLGNDYSQKAQALDTAGRQRLLEARFATDEAYNRLAGRLRSTLDDGG